MVDASAKHFGVYWTKWWDFCMKWLMEGSFHEESIRAILRK